MLSLASLLQTSKLRTITVYFNVHCNCPDFACFVLSLQPVLKQNWTEINPNQTHLATNLILIATN